LASNYLEGQDLRATSIEKQRIVKVENYMFRTRFPDVRAYTKR